MYAHARPAIYAESQPINPKSTGLFPPDAALGVFSTPTPPM